MKTNLFLGSLLLSIATIIITSCSNDEIVENATEVSEKPSPTSITAKIIDLGTGDDTFFDEYPKVRTTTNIGAPEESNEDIEIEEDGQPVTQRLVCTRQKVSVEAGSDDFQLFGGLSSDVIFPGNLLQGKTVVDPEVTTPSIIPVKRAGGTISINLNAGATITDVTVDEVKISTIQNAINQIINSSPNAVPANFNLSIEQIESEEQLALEMGLSFKGWKAKVESKVSFSTEKQFNRTLVKLTQTFYTINFDTPTRPEDIFASDVTPEEYAPYIDQNNPATFISSVAYGRIFYMLVESTSSREEMLAKLNISYKSFGNSGSGDLDVETFKELKDLKIKVIAYGGDSERAIAIAGETTVENIANRLAKGTNIQTALPLSYKVRSVYNPSRVVGVRLGTEFDVVECEIKGTYPPSAYRGLVGLFEDGIGAVAQVKDGIILLFNTAGNQYAFYNVTSGKLLNEVYMLNDPNGPLAECKLSDVGAAYLDHFNNSNSNIRLTSLDGLRTTKFKFKKGAFFNTMTELPQNYDSMDIRFDPHVRLSADYFSSTHAYTGTYPFAGQEIDAIYFNNIDGKFPDDSYTFISRNVNGTFVATTDGRNSNDKQIWQGDKPWVDSDGLKGIGAIGTVNLGAARERIFFDISGEKFMIVKSNGTRLGPFVVN